MEEDSRSSILGHHDEAGPHLHEGSWSLPKAEQHTTHSHSPSKRRQTHINVANITLLLEGRIYKFTFHHGVRFAMMASNSSFV